MSEKFDPKANQNSKEPAQNIEPQADIVSLRQLAPPPLQLKNSEPEEKPEEVENSEQQPFQADFDQAPPLPPEDGDHPSNTPIQRDGEDNGDGGDDDGDEETTSPYRLRVPDLSYNPWAPNQNRFSLGVDFNLDVDTDLDLRLSFREYLQQQLAIPRIRTDLLRVNPDEFFQPIFDPLNQQQNTWELAPGPNPPEQASFGLLWSAVKTTPAVAKILSDVESQAADAWSSLETGQQVVLASSLVVVGGGALTGMYMDPNLRGLVNGVPLPVPGVSGLALELYIPDDNSSFFIGAHLDLGQFLPESWGFGSASDPMNLPPSLRYRAATWPNSLSETLMRKTDGQEANGDAPTNERPTMQLPFTLQAKASEAFDTDVSNVRIHPNSENAKTVQAKAYTQGNNIFFAPGQFNPESQSGQELIGHELGHVVQQQKSAVPATNTIKGMPLNDDVNLEREADQMGQNFAKAKGQSPEQATPLQARTSEVISRVGDGPTESRDVAMANRELGELVQDYTQRIRRDRRRIGAAYEIFEELKVMRTSNPAMFRRFMDHHSDLFYEIAEYLPAEYLDQADFGFYAGLNAEGFEELISILEEPGTWSLDKLGNLEMLLATAIQYAIANNLAVAQDRITDLVTARYGAAPDPDLKAALEKAGLQVPDTPGAEICFQPEASTDILTESRGGTGVFGGRPYRQTLRESNQSGYGNRRTFLGEGLELLFKGESKIDGISLAALQNATGMPGQYYGIQFTEGENAGRLNVAINRSAKILTVTSEALPVDSISYALDDSTVRTGGGALNGLTLTISYNQEEDTEDIQFETMTIDVQSLDINAIRYLTEDTTFGIGKISATRVQVIQETMIAGDGFLGVLSGAFYQFLNIVTERIPQLKHQFSPDKENSSPEEFLQAEMENLGRESSFSLDFANLNIEGLYYTGTGEIGDLNIEGFNQEGSTLEQNVLDLRTNLTTELHDPAQYQQFAEQLRGLREELEDAEKVYYRRQRRRLSQDRGRLTRARDEVVRLRNKIENLECEMTAIAPQVDLQIDTGTVTYTPPASLLQNLVNEKLEGLGLSGISYEGDVVLSADLALNTELTTQGNQNTSLQLRGLQLPTIRVAHVNINAGEYHIVANGALLEEAVIYATLNFNDTTQPRPGKEWGQLLSGVNIHEACFQLFRTDNLNVKKGSESAQFLNTGQIILSNLNVSNLDVTLDNLSPTMKTGQLGVTADAIMVENLDAAGVDLTDGWFWLTALEMRTLDPVIDQENNRRSTTREFTTRSATDEEVQINGDPSSAINAADVHHNIKVNNLKLTDTVHEMLDDQNEPTGQTSRDMKVELDVAHVDIDALDLNLPGQLNVCTEQNVMVNNILLEASYHMNVADPATGALTDNNQLELTKLEVGQIHVGQGTMEVFDGERVQEIVTNGSIDLYGLYARNVIMNMNLQPDGERSSELISGEFGLASMDIRQVIFNALNIQRFQTGAIAVQRVGNPNQGYYSFSANNVRGQATYEDDGNTASVQIGNEAEGNASFSGRYSDNGALELSSINVPYFRLDQLDWTASNGIRIIATDGVRLHRTEGSLEVDFAENADGEKIVQSIRVPKLDIDLLESSALQVRFGSMDLDVGDSTYIEDVEVRDFYIPINEEGDLEGRIDTGAMNVNDLVLTMSDPGLVFRTDIVAEGLHFRAADGAIDVTADNPLFSGTNFQYGEHGDDLFVHLGLTSALPLIDPESIEMNLVPSEDGQLFYLTLVRPRLNSIPLQVKTINSAGIETSVLTSLDGRIDQNVVVEYFPNSEGGHLLNVVTDEITLNGVDVQVDVSENTETDFSFINYIEDAMLSNHESPHNSIDLMLFGEAHRLRTIQHGTGENAELGVNVQDLFEQVNETFQDNLDELMEALIDTDTGADTIRDILDSIEFRENEGNYSLMLILRVFGWEAFDFELFSLINAEHTFEEDGETWVLFKELILNWVPDEAEIEAEEASFFDSLREYAEYADYIPGMTREEAIAFVNGLEILLDAWLNFHVYPTLWRMLDPGLQANMDISDLRFAQEGADGASVTFTEAELGVPSIMNLDLSINSALEAQGNIQIPTMEVDLPDLDSCLVIGTSRIQGLNAPLDPEGTRSNYHADSLIIDFMSFSKEIEPETPSGTTE